MEYENYYKERHWEHDKEFVEKVFLPSKAGQNSGLTPQDCLMIIAYGRDRGLSPTVSLTRIKLGDSGFIMMGDLALQLVVSSGTIDNYTETRSGSVEAGDFKVVLTGLNNETKQEVSREYSVESAKRAGLWVDDQMVEQNPALKGSFWYRFPENQIYYRCLGFFLRQGWGMIIGQVHIEEELVEHEGAMRVVTSPDGESRSVDLAAVHSRGAKADEEAKGAIDSANKGVGPGGFAPSKATGSSIEEGAKQTSGEQGHSEPTGGYSAVGPHVAMSREEYLKLDLKELKKVCDERGLDYSEFKRVTRQRLVDMLMDHDKIKASQEAGVEVTAQDAATGEINKPAEVPTPPEQGGEGKDTPSEQEPKPESNKDSELPEWLQEQLEGLDKLEKGERNLDSVAHFYEHLKKNDLLDRFTNYVVDETDYSKATDVIRYESKETVTEIFEKMLSS